MERHRPAEPRPPLLCQTAPKEWRSVFETAPGINRPRPQGQSIRTKVPTRAHQRLKSLCLAEQRICSRTLFWGQTACGLSLLFVFILGGRTSRSTDPTLLAALWVCPQLWSRKIMPVFVTGLDGKLPDPRISFLFDQKNRIWMIFLLTR